MLKYLFMGSPPLAATILEALCEKLHPPEAMVTQIAKAAGRGQKDLPTAVELYAKAQELNLISAIDVNSPQTVEALRVFEPDLILVAAFGQILKKDILEMPKISCLNVHASLLPKYRGAAPIQRAIWNGDTKTGITIQKMARKLDTGDILLQREMDIKPEETSGELMARLATLGGECLVDAVRLIESGKHSFTPQDDSQATLAPKITREEAMLDWNRKASELFDDIRAFQPWPVAETNIGGARLKVFKAQVGDSVSGRTAGEIITDGKTFLSIVCGDGRVLALTEIQPENRKKLNVREFLNSYRGSFPYKTVGPYKTIG